MSERTGDAQQIARIDRIDTLATLASRFQGDQIAFCPLLVAAV